MRPISRTALGVATAAVLAVTAVAPSVAARPQDDATGSRPLVGSKTAVARQTDKPVTVTLVTGDKVLVSTDRSGRSAATALPREDGSVPLLETRQTGQDLYAYPEGAAEALAAGRADEELFNVTGLIRQGYDDAHTDAVPLIAVYDSSVDVARTVPVTPRGAARGPVLKAADGVALKADKKRGADFWADITSRRSRSGSGLKKLWLDRKVEATLEKSTAQVGADLAWAAGYDGKGTRVAVLDTGADAEHPDLQGRIVASKNFTDSRTTDDLQGHGTHTISTVGGSGAASGGRKKGVAPGAELLNGKVLSDYGSGATSWIIAGMQWAVDNKADVVSMSLGNAAPTDCTDPMSTAAEQLARSNNTLFVIAAGNSGRLNSVSSPGCAPSVLTVGAVDRDDSTAYFSSRGPARISHTLKPEIAAPGVGISAAAAGGRGIYAYRSMSGTSMATPHVAGAAAVVKQRHPDWSAQRIKAALVSSAKTSIPGDVRETGGGRLDVKAAIDATVLGAPAVQGGAFDWPQSSGDRTTVEVPYTNTTDRPVELGLAVQRVTGNDGTDVRSPIARLGKDSVTVPAGATVKVPLNLNPAAQLEPGQYGDITGRVLATANGVNASTPFSLYVQPETVTLRVKVVDRHGKPAANSSLDVVSTDTAVGDRRYNQGATVQEYRLRPGSYLLSSFVVTPDAGEGTKLADSIAYLGRPQLELKKDTTVVLDARDAHRLQIRTERPTEVRSGTLAFARTWDDTWQHAGALSGGRAIRGYYASVEGEATDGDFEFSSYWRAAAPLISELAVVGGETLHPVTASIGSVNLDGTGEAPLVDAKTGTPEELAAAGVQGKIALVRIADNQTYVAPLARNAKGAGAKAVITYHSAPGRWLPATGINGGDLPVLAVESTEATALLDRLAGGEVTLRWKATAKSPYVYNLAFPQRGAVDEDRTYRVDDDRLGRSESTYHAMGVAADFIDVVGAQRPNGARVFFPLDTAAAPGARTELFTPGDTSWDRFVSSSFPWGELMVGRRRAYQAGEQRTEQWYDGVIAPRAPIDAAGKPMLAAERQGNLIGFATAMWGDGSHHAVDGSFGDIGNLRLRRNGEQIRSSDYPFGVFEVPAEEGTYELEQFIEKFGAPAKVWQRSTAVRTVWKFRSALDENVYSQGIPILFPRYGLPEDGLKTLAAADGQKITLTATGHGGYTPAALVTAKLSYSYDSGTTWTEAPVTQHDGTWTATVDHAGASGKQVTLRAELTDANGNSVTQTVARAYDVR